MNYKYIDNKYHTYTLICIIYISLLALALGIISNLQHVVAISDNNNSDNAAGGSNPDPLDKGNLAEFFDFGIGIFAAVLFALSLIAYRNLKMKRILYVSCAFAIFAIHTLVSRLNLFVPDIESSALELILSVMEFVALASFFVAIVRKERVTTKTINR